MASPLILQLGGRFWTTADQERLEFNEGDVGLAGGIQAAGDGVETKRGAWNFPG